MTNIPRLNSTERKKRASIYLQLRFHSMNLKWFHFVYLYVFAPWVNIFNQYNLNPSSAVILYFSDLKSHFNVK